MNINSIKESVRKAASRDEPIEADELEPNLSLTLSEHKDLYEIDSLRQALKEAVDTHKLRLQYTSRIFGMVCGWLLGVIVCILLTGFRVWSFQLSDSVLIAFITSTTVNVVGLFFVVAKWMYTNSFHKEPDFSIAKPKSKAVPKNKTTSVN